MNLYILNSKLERVGIIDNFKTLVWERSFQGIGSFQLEIVSNKSIASLLIKGNYLLKSTDTTDLRYIDTLNISTDAEDIEYITVEGLSITSWLNRRITQCQETYSGTAETVMKSYVDNNCVSPSDTSRVIPGLSIAKDNSLGPTIDHLGHFKGLDTVIQGISEANGLGFLIRFNYYSRDFEFDVYCGTNRTTEQALNPRVIFSSGFENISDESYTSISRDLKTTAIVAGAGEEHNRKTITINSTHTGLNRYEMFVDARDIQDVITDEEGNETIIPPEEYDKLLETRGNESLQDYKVIDSFECSLLNTETSEYLVDYDLGDKITILNRRWGLIMHQTIVRVIETYDSSGRTVQIDIGDSVPTILDKIKRKIK